MTYYNNHRFTPGNQGSNTELRRFMARHVLETYQHNHDGDPQSNTVQSACDSTFRCGQFSANKLKQGYNDPSQTTADRISSMANLVSSKGRVTFGNANTPRPIMFNGGAEGQPGGSPAPLRNRF